MSISASNGFPEVLRAKLSGVVSLSDAQVSTLAAHYELLLKWNRVLNLTRVEGVEEMAERHYCESVFAGLQLPTGPVSIVDVGSGPGFPGIPIAVLRPECRVVLVESHQRKAVFLREVTRELARVEVRAVRAEAVKEEFDWIVSRAVSYEDLAHSLKRLARNADLLTGAEEPPVGIGMEWIRSVKLPWGKQRFVRIGRRVAEEDVL